ncbi:MAG: hypothetical protein QMC83_01910 [Thermodesulfovibrionales bacterium]|nr:hypothetical protein [Thermodesulfovibrionales bacterium]
MEKNVNVRAEAIKEISKEKARIFRKKTEGPSLLEQAALAWKKKKEAEVRQRQKETLKKEEAFGPSFRETFAKEVVDYDKRRLSTSAKGESDEIGWVQYKPWQKEEDEKKKKQIPLNMATIVAIRKKLIAMEWARALGKRNQDTRFHDLEQEAAMWKQRREEAGRRKEEIRMRIEGHKEVLSEALIEFSKGLRDKRDTMNPKELSALLEESLENAGEVFDIEWKENECLVWIEPWEEKKLRRLLGFDIPVIYRVKIDENLEITSYEKVEDEEIIESLREEILTKPLRESLEGISFNIDNEKETQQFLEDKLSRIGRLISLERTESGWLATVESWEEMRIRNIKRSGKPPVVTEEIEINWKDGKLEFALEEKGDDIDETQMNADISGNQR